MRGDSLRDFYAKSLALMGLALLGAVGAVVDYWPAAFSVPQAPALAALPFNLQPLSSDSIALVVANASENRPATQPVRFASVIEPAPAVSFEPASIVNAGPSIDAPASHVIESAAPQVIITPEEPGAPPTPDLFSSPFRSMTIAPASSSNGNGRDGFFASAKRLPGTILHGGAKGVLVVADAAQAAGGAVGGAVTNLGKKLFGGF